MKRILQYEVENYPNQQLIAGFDEVGRGAIAGPVVVACVILKSGFSHLSILMMKVMYYQKPVLIILAVKRLIYHEVKYHMVLLKTYNHSLQLILILNVFK